MGKRITSSAALVLAFGFAGFASAANFNRPADTYGPVVNDILQQAGADLRFRLDRCSAMPDLRCRFSSQRVAVVVQGQEAPPRIGRIIIATDLLQDHPRGLPHEAVTDALITLGATMMAFDPQLQREQRDQLISALAEGVHSSGQSEGSGVDADYVVALHQTASTLLVITVAPKPGR